MTTTDTVTLELPLATETEKRGGCSRAASCSGDIYVDEPQSYPLEMRRGGAKRHAVWSHLWTEPGNEAALHSFAAKLGLRREWFQDKPDFPHYDITEGKVRRAHKMGAVRLALRHWVEWRRRSRPNAKVSDAPDSAAPNRKPTL